MYIEILLYIPNTAIQSPKAKRKSWSPDLSRSYPQTWKKETRKCKGVNQFQIIFVCTANCSNRAHFIWLSVFDLCILAERKKLNTTVKETFKKNKEVKKKLPLGHLLNHYRRRPSPSCHYHCGVRLWSMHGWGVPLLGRRGIPGLLWGVALWWWCISLRWGRTVPLWGRTITLLGRGVPLLGLIRGRFFLKQSIA